MRLIVGIILVYNMLNAIEFDLGKGRVHMQGGIWGIDQRLSSDVNIYTLKEDQQPIYKQWYYRYAISHFTSQTMPFSLLENYIPIDVTHQMQGWDINLAIGKTVFQKHGSSIAVEGITGASFPWIESRWSQEIALKLFDFAQMTQTDISTYKMGVGAKFRHDFSRNISFLAHGIYAYQRGEIQNTLIPSSFSSEGSFKEFDMAFRWINDASFTLLPQNVYSTLGYRSKSWELDEVAMTLFEQQVSSSAMAFESDIGEVYFGIGYRF